MNRISKRIGLVLTALTVVVGGVTFMAGPAQAATASTFRWHAARRSYTISGDANCSSTFTDRIVLVDVPRGSTDTDTRTYTCTKANGTQYKFVLSFTAEYWADGYVRWLGVTGEVFKNGALCGRDTSRSNGVASKAYDVYNPLNNPVMRYPNTVSLWWNQLVNQGFQVRSTCGVTGGFWNFTEGYDSI